MIIGIACTVVISLVAIYQTIVARRWRGVAEKLDVVTDKQAECIEAWKKAHDEQQAQMMLGNKRYAELVAAIQRRDANRRRL